MEKIGKYRILSQIGSGGMGVIYKALDPDINREVAVKTIRGDLFAEGGAKDKVLKQFMVEAQAAGRLHHPHIATIYEVGREADLTYIVMRYIPGKSLRKVLESGKTFTAGEAADLLLPLCQALDYAHRNGIVHRDIKPENILLDDAGRPILVDFGIATIETVNVTRTRMTSATPAYISPEQILEGEVDHRTDIFSLGIILFELLAGRRPFTGDNVPSLLNRIVNEEPARLAGDEADPPRGMEAVIRKALAKKPADRYASCVEMAAALEEASGVMVTTAPLREVRTAKIAPRRKRRPWTERASLGNKAKAAVAAAMIVCAAAGGALLWTRVISPPPEHEALVAVSPFPSGSTAIPKSLVEYILDRSLMAATPLPVFVQSTPGLWSRQTDAKGAGRRAPRIEVGGRVDPTVTGYEITLTSSYKGKKRTRVFPCKGPLDLVTSQVNEMLAFIASTTEGEIGTMAGGRTFAQITTSDWDALSHFLKGQEAWDKLDSEAAHAEFKTALENDPDFGLALLKMAEVKLFRGDREDARLSCERALALKDRLIEYDVLRVNALLARLEARPRDERANLMKLIEAFPLKKEYLYEFAESYFHVGDGEEAIPSYVRAIEIDPSYALAHNHLAFCYAWTGSHDKAEEHFRTYVKLDETANSYDSLATGYMFAGRTEKALEALEKGRALDPRLDYLYGNFATNFQIVGALAKAEESLDRQAEVSTRDSTKQDVAFDRAYLHWLRGDPARAEAGLRPVRDHYSGPAFRSRLDESPNLPFWLTGVMAAERKDLPRLREAIGRLDQKVRTFEVNATNFFPVLKLLVHLRVLEGRLAGDLTGVVQNIEEGRRIKWRMGYWGSAYNLPFFLTQYARTLIDMGANLPLARQLLEEVLAYNPSYAPALVDAADLALAENNPEEARSAAKRARDALAQADPDFTVRKSLEAVERRIGGN
ncbi:MAG: tetratricopeptide repeat protein [Candidatus Aminicenantes bacterium]|nr:tetratricopeptide repeat protein [Candidatus Aminicenantes bacterium]